MSELVSLSPLQGPCEEPSSPNYLCFYDPVWKSIVTACTLRECTGITFRSTYIELNAWSGVQEV